MKVDGKAFKKAREQIAVEHIDDELTHGETAIGTQQWLADQASITTRTIQNLENKGVASLTVIDAVGCVLGIVGRELIIDYGQDAITCEAPQVIDFRPLLDMLAYPETYDKKLFLVTIDPIIINFHYIDYLTNSLLKEMSLKLYIGKKVVCFKWVYFASILPTTPWPGIKDIVSEIAFEAPNSRADPPTKYSDSIMFKQIEDSSSCLEWAGFIEEILRTKDSKIALIVNLDFGYFRKRLKILVSIEEVKTYIKKAEIKYNELYKRYDLKYPRFFQPRAIVWND